ncbi:hypothetical protein Y032_0044g969 [Ancylostoma ceylanicum]|uniref:Uncharacterized protein n=1 Tax=Ancylostoma ceylanicum TaxID=53326 RepID=A0A016UE02_9BILA|nr:hypothetical protein Y032_0044g969 [Ancylostoma ceylanicum]
MSAEGGKSEEKDNESRPPEVVLGSILQSLRGVESARERSERVREGLHAMARTGGSEAIHTTGNAYHDCYSRRLSHRTAYAAWLSAVDVGCCLARAAEEAYSIFHSDAVAATVHHRGWDS